MKKLRKSSLNFTFIQGDCHKSDFASPTKTKPYYSKFPEIGDSHI